MSLNIRIPILDEFSYTNKFINSFNEYNSKIRIIKLAKVFIIYYQNITNILFVINNFIMNK